MRYLLPLLALVVFVAGFTVTVEAAPTKPHPGPAKPVRVVNLPLDGSGNLRVAAGSQEPVVLELLAAPVTISQDDDIYAGPFSAAGAQIVGLRLHVSEASGAESCMAQGRFQWRWVESDEFIGHTYNDLRLPPPTPGAYRPMEAYVYLRNGEVELETPLLIFPQGPHARVHLSTYTACAVTIDSVQVLLD